MYLARVFSALVLSLSAITAVALPDNYTLGDVSLDGNAWTDDSTTITMGQTYALSIGLSYERPGLAFLTPNSPAGFVAGHTLSLQAGGNDIGMASASSPLTSSNIRLCTTFFCFPLVSQVDNATWLLEGTLNFNESFGSAGIYNVGFSSGNVDAFSRSLTVAAPQVAANPVPAPGTLAIFALGLFGLVGARRWKQRS